MEELEMQVSHIEHLIEENNLEELEHFLNELNISEVEELIDELREHGPLFLETLHLKRAVNVFRILDFPTQERILRKTAANKVRDIINERPTDDRPSLFGELKSNVVKHLIIMLPPQERKEALSMLGYPEDKVGRLKTQEYLTV